jgi:hypothetical protein
MENVIMNEGDNLFIYGTLSHKEISQGGRVGRYADHKCIYLFICVREPLRVLPPY